MYVGLPSLYGAWHYVLTALMQHLGLAEDVLDHRLNARTVYLNPISRFIYWNMNYHVEHHMFPLVPYHALPALHEELKADLPRPYSGIIETYREIIPTLCANSRTRLILSAASCPPPPAHSNRRRRSRRNSWGAGGEALRVNLA